MKKVLRGILIFAVVLAGSFLMKTAVVSAADDFVTVHTNSSWDVKDRSVNGTVFTASSYSSKGYILTAYRNGRTIRISDCASGGNVLSNGTIVLYCNEDNVLYKMNLSTGKTVRYRGLHSTAPLRSVTLCGKYGKDVYFIRDVPEGLLYKVNLTTKKAEKIPIGGKRVSSAEQQGKYFYFTDGTGAGKSYLGQWNAATGKFVKITDRPRIFKANSRYVYYTQVLSLNNTQSIATLAVKRYVMATGKRETLISSLKVRDVREITSTYVKYLDTNGNMKTRRF